MTLFEADHTIEGEGIFHKMVLSRFRSPAAIDASIERILLADYLSRSQKRAILYDNAARFLRLSPEEIAAHHESALV